MNTNLMAPFIGDEIYLKCTLEGVTQKQLLINHNGFTKWIEPEEDVFLLSSAKVKQNIESIPEGIVLGVIPNKQLKPISNSELFERILTAVCNYYHIPEVDMMTLANFRDRNLVTARYIVFHIFKELTKDIRPKVTLSDIGAPFGKDHATALYGIKTVNNLKETDKGFRLEYFTIFNSIKL